MLDPDSREAGALAAEFAEKAGALSSERWVAFDNEESLELWAGRTLGIDVVGWVPNIDPAEGGEERALWNADAEFAAFAANNRAVIAAALRRYAATPEPAADGALVARARAACEGVTPGPWHVTEREEGDLAVLFGDLHDVYVTICGDGGQINAIEEPVTAFIAAARDLVPSLADALAASERRAAQSDAIAARVLAEDAVENVAQALQDFDFEDGGVADGPIHKPGCELCDEQRNRARAVLAWARRDAQ